MTIEQLVNEAHETAIEKGWWDSERPDLEVHALIHSEIAEATEAFREGIIESQLEELADAVIRIADFCGSKRWDLDRMLRTKLDYNKTRSFRHGGKRA
jgi:hypothetical protein